MALPLMKRKIEARRFNHWYACENYQNTTAVVYILAFLSHEHTITQMDWIIAEKSSAILSIFNDILSISMTTEIIREKRLHTEDNGIY